MTMQTLDYETLKKAVANDAALRLNMRLHAAGGPGTKVFPPTYEGGVYAWETRRMDGNDIKTVLLDSVQSQANRMELALLQAYKEQKINFPMIQSDFSQFPEIGMITALEAPHRLADAIFRDSTLDNKKFRETALGKAFESCNAKEATALFQYCPTSLLFGSWDSTGKGGGLGNKFQRCIVSEIVAINARGGVLTSSRIDPLGITNAAKIYDDGNNGWTDKEQLDGQKKPKYFGKEQKRGKPSSINHRYIPPTIEVAKKNTHLLNIGEEIRGGVTMDYATLTCVISFPGLRRLSFPVKNGPNITQEAQTTLAAFGLVAMALQIKQGFDLRSRCLLIPEGEQKWELISRNGEIQLFSISPDSAIKLFNESVDHVNRHGFSWQNEPITLLPTMELLGIIKTSREHEIREEED
ncbi:MAG: type I-U CRISPR-associated protein Cas7 [Magnetococcales bacterium]|nr:type I-U CRISPR-associated protein Cas7 [Magnetococcales bacterium]